VTDDAPADTMRERAGANRLKVWLLVEANRLFVVGVLLALVLGALLVAAYATPNGLGRLSASDPVETTFQAFIGATITGVTLVLTLTQLVLSQELGAVSDQQERMQGAMEFRKDAESLFGDAAPPPAPAGFLRRLIEETESRAQALKDAVPDDGPTPAGTVAQMTIENASGVRDELQDAQFGTFEVLSAALNFNYSWKLYAARRLASESKSTLSEEAHEALEGLIEALELFGPTREHFKTLYFQWELVDLSRVILTAALPALVVSVYMVLYFDPSTVQGNVLGAPIAALAVSGAVVVAVLPFTVLLSYILRIATVAKRTLSIGPFVLRTRENRPDLDWE
jgi:hypothetical protein